MDDKQLINLMAWTWIHHGGDSTGFSHNQGKIKKEMQKLESEDKDRTGLDE